MDEESEARSSDSMPKITKQESGRTEIQIQVGGFSQLCPLKLFLKSHCPQSHSLSSNSTRIVTVLRHYVVWCNNLSLTGLLFLLDFEPFEGRDCVFTFLSILFAQQMPHILMYAWNSCIDTTVSSAVILVLKQIYSNTTDTKEQLKHRFHACLCAMLSLRNNRQTQKSTPKRSKWHCDTRIHISHICPLSEFSVCYFPCLYTSDVTTFYLLSDNYPSTL